MKKNHWTATILAAGLATAMTLTSFSSAMAQSGYSRMSCDQLWYARNAIYAAKGYCFETDRAIAVFGPGCFPPYGRLSSGEKRRVAEIKKWERRRGC